MLRIDRPMRPATFSFGLGLISCVESGFCSGWGRSGKLDRLCRFDRLGAFSWIRHGANYTAGSRGASLFIDKLQPTAALKVGQ